MTGRTLATTILRLLEVLAPGQEADGDDLTDVLGRVNSWLDSLGLYPLAMWKQISTQKTLASGTTSYTIGSGGDVNIARPDEIHGVGLVIDINAATPVEVPRTVFTDEQYRKIAQKTLASAFFQGIWYDHDHDSSGFGRIYPWPVPNVSYTAMRIYSRQPVATLDLDTTFVLPRGYQLLYETNGAVQAAPLFDRKPNKQIVDDARNTLARIQAKNLRPTAYKVPPGVPGMMRPRGDIRTG